MKEESINKLKNLLVATYKKFGDEKALLLRPGVGKCSWTGAEIAKEIEDETEFGIWMMDNMIQLTIDLVKRDKRNFDRDEFKRTFYDAGEKMGIKINDLQRLMAIVKESKQ